MRLQKFAICVIPVLALLSVNTSWSKPVEKDRIEKASKQFLKYRDYTPNLKSAGIDTKEERSKLRIKRLKPFNFSNKTLGYVIDFEPSGFVVFSSDDKMPPVKLHNDIGSFDQLPPAFLHVIELEMLEDYNYINAPENQNDMQNDHRFSDAWDSLTDEAASDNTSNNTTATDIALLSTSWHQIDPYNYYCPAAAGDYDGRAVAGCGAAAMAQILRFHGHPVSVANADISSYTDYDGDCQGTFSMIDTGVDVYDWTNMPASISNSSPNLQKQEIGKLIFHCAVALKEDFEADGTTSRMSDFENAFHTFFNYTTSPYERKNGNYTNTRWYKKIKTDIDSSKPIIYYLGGTGSNGGHVAVCDGYRNGNELHFVLGWSDLGAWYNMDSVVVSRPSRTYVWTLHGAVFDITPIPATNVSPAQEPLLVSPQDDAIDQPTNGLLLRWINGGSSTSYDIYFGTNPDLDSGNYQGNQSRPVYSLEQLQPNIAYYWRVDAVNSEGVIKRGICWSFTTGDRSPGQINVHKFSLLAGTVRGKDAIYSSGISDATIRDLETNEVIVSIESATMKEKIFVFPVNPGTFKKGKFSCKNTEGIFALDTNTHKFNFAAKNLNLQGLACPITLKITIGNYITQTVMDESIVNGTKPSPLKLMQGVMDSLDVTKSNFKKGKKPGTDSLSVSGTFTVDGDYTEAPLVITVDNQTFTILPGLMINKNGIDSCKAASAEGPLVTAKLDYNKCTFSISIKNATISQNDNVAFGLNCFNVDLQGFKTINLK